jgi:hypothetical protein
MGRDGEKVGLVCGEVGDVRMLVTACATMR